MKRSVAVLGHTPQFVRWAIAHRCPLRTMSDENLPDVSFRQLRSLREYSVGRSEGRVVEGVCLHRSATSSEPDQARGFFGTEILDAYGDESFVESCCGACPANAIEVPDSKNVDRTGDRHSEDRKSGLWAGCYGWLPATSGFQFDVTEEAFESRRLPDQGERDELVVMLDKAVDELGISQSADAIFKRSSPRWYGIWCTNKFEAEKLKFLHELFTHVAQQFETCPADLDHFVAALRRCVEHELVLHAELVPPGFSDGRTWQLSAYCPDCKCEMGGKGQQKCPACGRYGHPHEIRKSKVLGLRPYVLLNGVIGQSKTIELLKTIELSKKLDSD